MPPRNMLLSDIQHALLDGVEGETIFHGPYLNLLMEEEHRRHNALLAKLGAGKDDRSQAIVSAMVCEAYLDRMLAVVFPRYHDDILDDSKLFTFSMKIRMLQALCIVPIFITKATNLLRAARNAFAHDLELDRISGLPKKLQQQMRTLYESRWPGSGASDFDEVFFNIVELATASLIAYYVCLHDFNTAVRAPSFEKRLRLRSEKRASEATRFILEHIRTRPINPEEPNTGIFG
ncbi:hypothetical protein SAMN05216570_1044 [Dyella sp. OK004]|uniref:hypothetical protein n=1 Tax=Dyella sp. OK004 TaxID=1855292 RepID=UPI0008E7FF7E|nr:hypothetical protein [Dyella sp. OK004]SFR94751.1 hypothetical protein SAMN05216570_1044 [Dyella sp. OK004]